MITIGLRDARAHLPRFIMSIIAIALGVAFVLGSFAFRGMLDTQVDAMLATNADHDVYVRGSQRDNTNSGTETATYNTIGADLADTIKHVAGVSGVSVPESLTTGVLVGSDGTATASSGGTSSMALSSTHPWRSAHFTSGTYPKGRNQVAISSDTASAAHLHRGSTTTYVYPAAGPTKVTVSGIFDLDSSQAGTLIVGLDPAVIEQELAAQGSDTSKASVIGVYGRANRGSPLTADQQQALADAINAKLPAGSKAVAVTGDDYREAQSKATRDSIGFVQPLILIFALIALFVGTFIIANTFSMIVREAMRGYALLRSIGASPRQVFTTVIVQALTLGIIGSGAGILLGWGMTALIMRVIAMTGTTLEGSAVPTPGAIAIGIAVGVIVSLIGATLPAARAANTPPIQAMNETVNPEKPTLARGIGGTILAFAGLGIWWLAVAIANTGNAADGPTPWRAINELDTGWPLGIGAGLVVIGVIMLAPAIVAPAGKILGWLPSQVFRVTGRLATRNIGRSRRRTANTAAALFIGVALVSCLGVIASSVNTSISSVVDDNLHADYVLQSANYRIPSAALDQVRRLDDVSSVTTLTATPAITYGDNTAITRTMVVDDDFAHTTMPPVTVEGNLDSALSGTDDIIVGKSTAKDNGWHVGQRVTATFAPSSTTQSTYGAEAKTQTFTVAAIASGGAWDLGVFINTDEAKALGVTQILMTPQAFVTFKPGTNLAHARNQLTKVVKPYYVIAVMDHDEYRSALSGMVNQVLMIVYALLALSIIIAVFGIVNTLTLSVSERTREIGVLRAIGMSNGQVRGMIAIESSIIAVLGTLLGLATGVAAGVVIRACFASMGLSDLSIPWPQLGVFLLASIAVGILAALPPARQALRVPVLDAVVVD